jgi:BioD-like phosphotransacetylase family protein
MQANYLLHLKEKALVITPGDRADIMGALQANESALSCDFRHSVDR